MPPQSRGGPQRPSGFAQSKSSPNLTTIRTLGSASSLHLHQRERSEDAFIYRPSSPYLNPTANGDFSSDDNDNDDISTEEDDEDDGAHSDDNDNDSFPSLTSTERRRPDLQTTRSHPHLPPSSSQLFPPFYNRPPTPLPPSPSLTSLLRPSFSTHTSHHTTPDSSDTESGVGSTTFPHTASTSKAASTVGRVRGGPGITAPKVPTYEYYGFALYLASSLFFLMYTLWAYLPSPFLHQLGIYYYPNRWWALAIPCWLVVLVLWIYAALQSYNTGTLTLGMGSIECVVDEAGKVAVLDGQRNIVREKGNSRFAAKERGGGGGGGHRGGKKGPIRKQRSRQGSLEKERRGYFPADLGSDVPWRQLWNEGTDAVMDVPLGGVCEILYGEGRQLENEEPDEIEL